MPNAAPRGVAAFGYCQLHFNCVVRPSVRAAWCIDQYSYFSVQLLRGAFANFSTWCIHQYNCLLQSSLHLLRCYIHPYICCLQHSSGQDCRWSIPALACDPRLLRLERVGWWALALHHQPSRNIMPVFAEARCDLRHMSSKPHKWGGS